MDFYKGRNKIGIKWILYGVLKALKMFPTTKYSKHKKM